MENNDALYRTVMEKLYFTWRKRSLTTLKEKVVSVFQESWKNIHTGETQVDVNVQNNWDTLLSFTSTDPPQGVVGG